jgi:hypothetical protein
MAIDSLSLRQKLHFASKIGFRAACPGAQTPLYVRPPHRGTPSAGLGRNGSSAVNALICRANFADSKAAMSRPFMVAAKQALSLPSSIG